MLIGASDILNFRCSGCFYEQRRRLDGRRPTSSGPPSERRLQLTFTTSEGAFQKIGSYSGGQVSTTQAIPYPGGASTRPDDVVEPPPTLIGPITYSVVGSVLFLAFAAVS